MTTFLLRAFLAAAIAAPLLIPSTFAAGPEGRSPAIDPAFKPPAITVPEGFVVELAAGPPLVKHPIMAGFDDRGRLFVSETAGLNLRNNELAEQLPNYITVIEDADGDGFFDQSTRFADQMTFPQGALWFDGALYVCSPPGLWRLDDTDGDGKADKRTQLTAGFDYTGNAADVHGPFLGPTGRLYWCHGRKGHEVRQPDGMLVSKGKGARVWSCKPDGSDIQVHAGGGMDNPVEVDFTSEGDMLGTINLFHGRPRGDTLVHWLYGGAYPRHDQEAVLAEFKRTGDLLPEVFNYGHVAVSGMTRYRSRTFGADFQNNLFITYFNTQKVTRSILTRDGATYRCRNVDFFYADSTDVHPTDVLEDADGSLLIVDTGGWFRIGCPTSQVAKPDIYGAIYRIRKSGAQSAKDPRGLKIDWTTISNRQLAQWLADDRFAVSDRAISMLASRGGAAIPALSEVLTSNLVAARRNAVWALARIGSSDALAALRTALKDFDPGVQQAACHSAGMLQDKEAVSVLVSLVGRGEPPVQREAAAALGRIGDQRAVSPILQLLAAPIDRSLEHALIYALIEINRPGLVLRCLSRSNPVLQRRTLIALDQMNDNQLTAALVLPLLDVSDTDLRFAAIDVVRRRSDWSDDTVALLDSWLMEARLSAHRHEALAGILPNLLANERAQAVAGRMLCRWKNEPVTCAAALSAIAQSGVTNLHVSWQKPIEESLACEDRDLSVHLMRTIAGLKTDCFDQRLRQISADANQSALLRIQAMAAMAARSGALHESTFTMLIAQISSRVPAATRMEASQLLSTAKLTQPQLIELARALPSSGPLELPILINAFHQSRDKDAGIALVAALSSSTAITTLNVSDLQTLIRRFPAEAGKLAKPMLDELQAAAEQQTARLLKTDAELPLGDAERGKAVFFSQQTVCATCHRVGDQGGDIGPDLSRIGRIRTQRDLLEAILFPSASFARDYESYTISTNDGESHSGVIQRETSEALYVATASGTATKIPRDSIQSMTPSHISTMPQGLENVLSREQLADLIAYLRSLR